MDENVRKSYYKYSNKLKKLFLTFDTDYLWIFDVSRPSLKYGTFTGKKDFFKLYWWLQDEFLPAVMS